MHSVLLNLIYVAATCYLVTIGEDLWAIATLVLLVLISSMWATVRRDAASDGRPMRVTH